MPLSKLRSLSLCSLAALAAAASSQTPHPQPVGTVTGHVLCSDTQGPARLAEVKLLAVLASSDDKANPALNDAPAGDPVQTSLDGSYILRNVKPGEYYVVVDKPGYLLPLAAFSRKELTHPDPATSLRIARVAHAFTVAADQTTQQDVVLERGASVSGTVLYDDGSPAAGIDIQLLVKDEQGKWVDAALNNYRFRFPTQTDDNGHYRLTGLSPGEYATEAILALNDIETTSGPMPSAPDKTMQIHITTTRFSLPLYSGDVFRKPQAVAYTLGSGEARAGSDLVFPLAKLHKVTGQVLARDGHALNGGKIDLLYADDKTKMTQAQVQYDDRTFHLEFVPEGDFLLKISGARDLTRIQVENSPGYTPRFHEESKVLKTYGDVQQPLLVKGDISDVLATVPDLKPTTR